MSWYNKYKRHGRKVGEPPRSRQSITSDISKRASHTSKKAWGGRWADGPADKMKKTGFMYKKRKANKAGGITYHYPTKVRRKWKSYGKKY